MTSSNAPSPTPHGHGEDIYAMFVGTIHLAVGLVLLRAAGLATGGVAGVALVLSYATGWPVGLLYALISAPLMAITLRSMSWRFLIKTAVVTLGLFAMTALAPMGIDIARVSDPVAAVVGGSVIGMGALALARHGAATGGSGALVLWLYRTRGWNAGHPAHHRRYGAAVRRLTARCGAHGLVAAGRRGDGGHPLGLAPPGPLYRILKRVPCPAGPPRLPHKAE
ncbi:YitT family protein [Novosphingobium resinovorum]